MKNFLKVPEEINPDRLISNDDIENRTKIMMDFMDDLTNMYFSTKNSLRLTVETSCKICSFIKRTTTKKEKQTKCKIFSLFR